jgi:glycerol-3-phosphate dehydrogenase (NAD(P)+)
MTLGIIGGGAFGTGLAVALGQHMPVTLWARNAEHVRDMRKDRENKLRLKGIAFPDQLSVTEDIQDALASDTVLLAVPMQQLQSLLNDIDLSGKAAVACCKGIDLTSGEGPIALLERLQPAATAALLTGPSFAQDIGAGLPTALTLACKDEKAAQGLQQTLTQGNIRIYTTNDTIGAELGGALKNVMAIACGAAIGAGYGDSARAALLTRGYAELIRFAKDKGAAPETLAGLSGFGDLVLTCTSPQSRNYSLGQAIGRSEPFDSTITVEGAATARAVLKQAQAANIDMPITATVVGLLDQTINIKDAMAALLARPLRKE